MAQILILVGTETGNSQMVAECLEEDFQKAGHEVEIIDDGSTDAADIASREIVLVCTSTYGMGEFPMNFQAVYDSLDDTKPDLSALRYGVIALGDQTYQDTFCDAGKNIDKLLRELGGQRIGERLEIDACTQPLPDDEAQKWAAEWVTLL